MNKYPLVELAVPLAPSNLPNVFPLWPLDIYMIYAPLSEKKFMSVLCAGL